MLIEARPWALSAAPLLRLISAELRVIPMHKLSSSTLKILIMTESCWTSLTKMPKPVNDLKSLWISRISGGFVVGTVISQKRMLGWCTFNVDHMSMYHVDVGVPKTLLRYIIESALKLKVPRTSPLCCVTSVPFRFT
jgi:hypothetical protein